jgi:GDP-L-fucose synthase
MSNQAETLLVTGANGFLGSRIRALAPRYYPNATILAPTRQELDLTDRAATKDYLSKTKPTIVVHAAAKVGGIHYNELYPAEIFDTNILLTTNILAACAAAKVRKLVNVNSACGYPGEASGNLSEETYLDGPLHRSVEVYGFSKRAQLIGGRAYHKQYGLVTINLALANLYGPGDTFDFEGGRAHVVSALIRRFYEATRDSAPSVTCWGTGRAIREFIHVEDTAHAILRASQSFSDCDAVLNVGTGIGTTIKELTELVVELTGYRGSVLWDSSKPDGTMRKVLNIEKMKRALGWEPEISLRDGLMSSIEWFSKNYDEAIKR